MIRCQRCLEPLTPDTPYAVWIATGKCRRCLIARSESGHECAWCLGEFKIEPREDESHGICERHVAKVGAEFEALRKNLVPAPSIQ